MTRISVDDSTFVLALTGAGVSAESGIPTYRGSGGLWENHSFEELASPRGFARDPSLVWRFYSERRQKALTCEPNPGHRALVALERALGDRFLLATQNVDGLHRRAGSQRMVELHGCLFRTRCTTCERPPFEDERTYFEVPPCDRCEAKGGSGRLRPHIVWFGEALDSQELARIEDFMRAGAGKRLVFLAAGTSGAVYPAAGLVDVARAYGAQTWLVNAEPADNVGRFERFVRGKSGEVLPSLFDVRGASPPRE
jgi:NAD-dependent deacetylase